MPVKIVRLLSFEGPNLFSPHPSVFLQLATEKDRSRALSNALKDAAQSAGIVIGQLSCTATPTADGYQIVASFVTPTPALGAEIARYVVAGFNARSQGDEAWDAEEPLWQLQKRRRAEALPVQALQLQAEAQRRNVPALVRPGPVLQLGYGARSQAIDLARFRRDSGSTTLDATAIGVGSPASARTTAPPDITWEAVGAIPIAAISGGAARDRAARLLAGALEAAGRPVRLATSADLAEVYGVLADRTAEMAVVALETTALAHQGLGFTRCTWSAVTDLPGDLPPLLFNHDELARALGVPMLVTDPAGCAVLNVDVPALAALAAYAPCPLIAISAQPASQAVAAQRARNGAALFVRSEVVIAAHGPDEHALGAAPREPYPGLAALALLWGMGFAPDRLAWLLANQFDAA